MNIYEMSLPGGNIKFFLVAEDEDDAKLQAADSTTNPVSYFLPLQPTLVSVPGYEITVYPEGTALNALEDDPEDEETPTEREELKAILTERGIEFNPRLGDAKLRELVEQTAPQEAEEEPQDG